MISISSMTPPLNLHSCHSVVHVVWPFIPSSVLSIKAAVI